MELWGDLFFVIARMECPTLIPCYFNMVLNKNEKIGGLTFVDIDVKYFRTL